MVESQLADPGSPALPPRALPPLSPPPRGRWGMGKTLVVGAALAALVSAGSLWSEVRRLRQQQAASVSQQSSAEVQLRQLTQQHEELSRAHEQLLVDRDNLLAQVQRTQHEQEHVQAERQLLEDVFKRTASERLGLLNRMRPLEAHSGELERDRQALVDEQHRLERELRKANDRSKEQALRTQLSQTQRQHASLLRTLRDDKRQLRKTAQREQRATTHLMTLTKRLEQLQQEYAQEVSDNASLRRQVTRLPKDVTSLAREHERLLKDVADTHYNMGVMFAKRGDFVRAAKEFQQVVEVRPDDAEAHYNLGLIYAEHLPDRRRALGFFRKYLALNPSGQDVSWAKQYIATWQAWEAKERLE